MLILAFSIPHFAFFFFFLRVKSNLTWVHCSRTVYALKNIKNGSHDTIQFSVSATISLIQTDPMCIIILRWFVLNDLGLIGPKPPIYLYHELCLSHNGRSKEEVGDVSDDPTMAPNH